MTDIAFNFRATSGFVTDVAPEVPVLGTETYPNTFSSGVVGGWDANISTNSRDRLNTNDRRLAGVNSVPNSGTQNVFRVDLPVAGQYLIRIALGDTSAQAYMRADIFDNTTSLLSVINTLNTGTLWGDTVSTNVWTNAQWPGSNVAATLTFATTTFFLKLGATSAQSNASPLAHLFISPAGPVLAPVGPARRMNPQQRMVA